MKLVRQIQIAIIEDAFIYLSFIRPGKRNGDVQRDTVHPGGKSEVAIIGFPDLLRGIIPILFILAIRIAYLDDDDPFVMLDKARNLDCRSIMALRGVVYI